VGFGFDILPVDPDCQDERGGWVHSEEEDEEEVDDNDPLPPPGSDPARDPNDDDALPW
jgi:hypothetical protein